jgi:hypothetical protein
MKAGPKPWQRSRKRGPAGAERILRAWAAPPRPRLPAPVPPETCTMPPHHGIRPDNGKRFAGVRKQLADPAQNHPVDGQKRYPTGPPSSQHNDLLTQDKDLGFHHRARPKQVDHKRNNQSAEIHHPAEDHPILRLRPTGWNLRKASVRPRGRGTGQILGRGFTVSPTRSDFSRAVLAGLKSLQQS